MVTGWDGGHATIELMPSAQKQLIIRTRLASDQAPIQIANDRQFHMDLQSNQRDWKLIIEFEQSYAFNTRNGDLIPVVKVSIPVFAVAGMRNLQSEAVKALNISWTPGSFAESFPELSQLSSGLGSLQLEALEKHLATLRSKEGSSVELFGAKVPSDSLRTWGLLILLSVQIYFALHLERFRRLFALSVRGDEYPWIGIYR